MYFEFRLILFESRNYFQSILFTNQINQENQNETQVSDLCAMKR